MNVHDQKASGASAVDVRTAHWRDIPAMAELERAAFSQDPWTEPVLWAELAMRPRRHYLVVSGGGPQPAPVLAYAGTDLGGEVADVMTVAVHPDARGQGIGGLLLECLHQRARASGARRMVLEVRADNSVARGLYEREGYEVLHTRRGYYRADQGPAVDALVLQKDLLGVEARDQEVDG